MSRAHSCAGNRRIEAAAGKLAADARQN